MKNFMVFHAENYEAGTGMNDFVGDFHDQQAAMLLLDRLIDNDDAPTHGHVYDIQNREIIYRKNEG